MVMVRNILCKLFFTLSVVVMLLQVAQPYIYGAVMAHSMGGHHSLLADAEEDAVRLGSSESRFSFQPIMTEAVDMTASLRAESLSTPLPNLTVDQLHVPLFISHRNIRI